jgi:hypothetical protein
MDAPILHATPESILAAKLANQRERAAVARETGVVIRADGSILMPVKIRCAKCEFHASGRRVGTAVKGLTTHLKAKHWPAWVMQIAPRQES